MERVVLQTAENEQKEQMSVDNKSEGSKGPGTSDPERVVRGWRRPVQKGEEESRKQHSLASWGCHELGESRV